MKTVYESQLAVEAHMILHLLQGAGIEGQVLGEHLQSGAGELPVVGLARVVVADEKEAEARSLIADWERSQPVEKQPVRATSRRPVVALAFLVGALAGAFAVWWALRTPLGTQAWDLDDDGIADSMTRYAGEVPVESTYDRDADGEPDLRVGYDRRGLMETLAQDDNFDGTFESVITYRKDQPADLEWDRDGNRSVDVRCQYRFGVVATCQYLDDATNKVIKRETYQDGMLRSAELDTDSDGIFDVRRELDWKGEITRSSRPAQE